MKIFTYAKSKMFKNINNKNDRQGRSQTGYPCWPSEFL